MVVNPLILPPFLLILLAYVMETPPSVVWKLGLVGGLLYFILPLVYIALLLKHGKIESIEARNQSNRSGPLWVGVLLLVVAIPGVWLVTNEVSSIFSLVAVLFAVNGLVIAFVTPSFKISIHSSGMAGFVSIPFVLELLNWIPAFPGGNGVFIGSLIFVGLVGWARVFSGAHTLKQVIWGSGLGLLLPALEIALLAKVYQP